jgi:hypothetical protein
MAYSRLFRLGSSDFPLGTSPAQILRGRTIGSAKLARADGNVQTVGYHNGIEVELRVPICRGPLDTSALRAREDAVKEILDQGPANLFLWNDRYWRCVESRSEPTLIQATTFDRFHELSVSLIGPDDVTFSTATTTDSWTPTSGGERNIVLSGNALAYPTISVTVGGSGLETIAFTISNTYTYRGEEKTEEFTLTGDVTAGDVIVVKCLPRQTVKIGTTDRMDLVDGIFSRMFTGTNVITTSWSASSISAMSLSVNERWL